MHDGSSARLQDLFPRLDVLPVAVRLQLSELLATPASVPALLVQEVAGLRLPADGGRRPALRPIIQKGLDPAAIASLRDATLADVIPLVRGCAGGPGLVECPVRLREILRRQNVTSWTDLGALTIDEMQRWTNMGALSLAALIGIALEAVLEATIPDEPGPAAGVEPGSPALALLLHHEGVTGNKDLHRALEGHAHGDGPAEVRAAARHLLTAADRAGDPRLARLARIWEAAGNHRDRGIFAHRALRLDGRTPTKELARSLGLSETRIGQIQARAEEDARQAAGADPAVEQLSAELRNRLPAVGRRSTVDDALVALNLPTSDDPRSALVVWLAGPYSPVSGQPGWVATHPATVLADTRRILHEDGGVRQAGHIAADLEAAGFASGDIGDWLRTQPVVVVHGLVVALTGAATDVAERLLSATGRAMTPGELAAASGSPGAALVLDGRLRRDPRFTRVGPDHFELAEWGGEPFIDPMRAELFPGAGGRRAATGRSKLRIDIDAGVLRGAAGPVSPEVVDALGVPCGGRRTFTTRFGPIALHHAADGASRGSVRPVALAAGAGAGDALVIEFDAATGHASVELVQTARSAIS